MDKFRNLQIKNKLIAIILSLTIFTLSIVFAGILIYDKKSWTSALHNTLDIIIEQTSTNLLSTLQFQYGSAKITVELVSVLEPLKNFPAITNAFVYDKDGQLVAEYPPSFSNLHKRFEDEGKPAPQTDPYREFKKMYPFPAPRLSPDAEAERKTEGSFIHITKPIFFKERFGIIYLRATTQYVDESINRLFYFMVSLVGILIIISIFLANRLQAIISKPILNLLNVTRQVSVQGNYSIRAAKETNDEIGMLYDGFNEMMEQIQDRDVQRNRVKNELRASQFFLSSVIDSMPSLLITIESNGRVTQWNKAAATVTGMNVEEATGSNIRQIFPDFAEFDEVIAKITGDHKPRDFYKKSLRLHGNTYFFNGSIFPLMENTSTRFVIMLNDVTEIEQKEKQLRQSQKMETVGNLAGGLAHDFNNVLGGIIGTISLFKYKTAKNKEVTPAETEKYFNTIEDAANRASDMVKHLLSLTRKQELTFTPTDLNTTIRNIVKICNNTFDKSIEIITNYSKEKSIVNADPTQIEQALLNLCINASHAMTIMRKEGDKYGGSLTITLKKVWADKYFLQHHSEAEEQYYWDISVQDTGVGINQKTIPRIFDPFFTTKREGTGTGLGLAMVYNIIKQHKGAISVYSQEDVGATFHIYLPVLEGEIVNEFIPREEEIPHGEGIILVVDDEEVMRQTAQSILIECGYTVLTAENGQEALEIYLRKKEEIDLILLDMVMPKMSGKQTYLELRKFDQEVQVLLVSGFKQDQRVQSILDMGVRGFIQKPYTMRILATQIHRVLMENMNAKKRAVNK